MTADEKPPGAGQNEAVEADDRPFGCEDAVESVFEYLDGELPPEHSELVRRHIEMCKRCYPYFNFERAFLDYLHDRGVKAARSAELESKLNRLLEELEADEEPVG